MKKTHLVTASVVGALALAYPATAWFLGMRVQAAVDEAYAMAAEYPYVRVVKRDYQRGVFSATEVVTLELFGPGPAAGEAPADAQSLQADGEAASPSPMQVTIRSDIRHGPFPGLHAVGAATVDSELVVDGELAQTLATLTGGQKLVTARTVYGFTGGGTSELSSPAFTTALPTGEADVSQRVEWGGLQLSMAFDRGLAHYTLSGAAPRLAVSGGADAGRFELSDLRIEGDQTRLFDDEPLLYAGSMKLTVNEMRFSGGPAAPGAPLQLKQLAYEVSMPVDGDFVSIAGKIGAEVVQFGSQNFGPAHYDLSLNHLHARTVAKLHRAWLKLSSDPAFMAASAAEGGAGAAFAPLAEPAVELLKHAPELRIDRLSFNSAHGEARMVGRAALKDPSPEALANPLILLGHLDASAEVSLPEGLVGEFAGGGSDPETAATRGAMLQQQLDGFAAQGLIKREGGLIKAEVRFAGGQLAVNGRPIGPLPGGGAN